MTLIEDLAATNDVAMAVTAALEQALGEDVILAVGVAQQQAPDADLLPEGATRTVSLARPTASTARSRSSWASSSPPGSRPAPPTSCSRRARTCARSGRGRNRAAWSPSSCTRAGDGSRDRDRRGRRRLEFVVYPLSANDERVACLVIQLAGGDGASVALHEFATLGDGSPGFDGSRPLAILNDVEMGVTAELGRRRMTVRDLLALTPGSVIELDRAAGTPGRRARERHADRAR